MTDEAWIDTVRLARDMGTVRELLPEEFPELRDCPYTLFEAIRLAGIFIQWEELPEEEQPPRRIWMDGEALGEWFAEVKRKRARELEGAGRDSSRDIEDPVENEAARALIVG